MSLSYNTAQRLKEAGFPQIGKSFIWFDPSGSEKIRMHLSDVIDFKNTGYTYSPLLSELISEMPMRKKYLGTVNDAHFVLRKLVGVRPAYRACYEDEDTGMPVPGYDFVNEIPEEAVSLLWMEINRK